MKGTSACNIWKKNSHVKGKPYFGIQPEIKDFWLELSALSSQRSRVKSHRSLYGFLLLKFRKLEVLLKFGPQGLDSPSHPQ